MARDQTPEPPDVECDVFLSYSSADSVIAQSIAARLEDEAGLRPFLDKWNLIPGDPWQEALERALKGSRSCAVLVSSPELGPWHHEEMRAALQIRASDSNFRVIPVLLPGSTPESRTSLPIFLRRLTWVDLSQQPDFEEGFAALVSGIRGIAPGRLQAPYAEGRTSWEHYDWLLEIDEYQIAYIPLINADLGEGTTLRREGLQLSAESRAFRLPKEFRFTTVRSRFSNDRSCRLSTYQFTGGHDPLLALRFSETSYEDYLKSGEHLDDPHPSDTNLTLRDRYGGLFRDGVRNLRPFPLTNICGVGLFVVSSDGFVIASRHSERSHVYPGRLTFTASGTMKWAALPDPFSQVVRKAWEELRHQVVLDLLAMIGFGADARKLYFQCSFVEDHPASCADLERQFASYKIKSIPLEPDAVAEALLADCWEPAAEASLLSLVAQRHGKEEVVEALRQRRSSWHHRNMRDEWDYRASRPGVLADMSVRYPADKLNSASRRYVNSVLSFLDDDLVATIRVVEVGGGTGRITEKLVDRAGSLTVVDLSEKMIERNKARLGRKAKRVASYITDFAQDCLDSQTFDLALASLVLLHNVDQDDFVGLVRSMCRAAPVVVVCEDVTPNRPTSPRTKIRTKAKILGAFQDMGFQLTKQSRLSLFQDRLWLARFATVAD